MIAANASDLAAIGPIARFQGQRTATARDRLFRSTPVVPVRSVRAAPRRSTCFGVHSTFLVGAILAAVLRGVGSHATPCGYSHRATTPTRIGDPGISATMPPGFSALPVAEHSNAVINRGTLSSMRRRRATCLSEAPTTDQCAALWLESVAAPCRLQLLQHRHSCTARCGCTTPPAQLLHCG